MGGEIALEDGDSFDEDSVVDSFLLVVLLLVENDLFSVLVVIGGDEAVL